MNLQIIFGIFVLLILVSIQYTLNKILVEIKRIKTTEIDKESQGGRYSG